MFRDESIMISKNNEFANEFTDFHICFTNKTRKQVNHQMMRKMGKNKKTTKLQAIPTDDRTRDVALFVGCPVIAKKICKQNRPLLYEAQLFHGSSLNHCNRLKHGLVDCGRCLWPMIFNFLFFYFFGQHQSLYLVFF